MGLLSATLLLQALTLSVGCQDQFDPYNEVVGFRLLAMKAEKPWLLPGASTTLSALVVPDPVDPQPITYRWSWCPITTGSSGGYACATTQEELQTMVDEAIGPGIVTIPSFDLGTTETSTFTYSLSPLLLQGVCEKIAEGDIPEFVDVPECEGRYPMTIRLEVTSGGRTIVGVKTLNLILTGTDQNSNPELQDIEIQAENESQDPALSLFTSIASDGTTIIKPNVEYALKLGIEPETAETYTTTTSAGLTSTTRERLVVTWFIEGGETQKTRTSFLDGEIPLEQTELNTWTTPKTVDYDRKTLRLWIVIRDDREGASWFERTLKVED